MNLLVMLCYFLAFLVPSCFSCPANFYPVLAVCHACPYHTESHENSTSAHDCRCVPGFICIYYKQVRATLLVNSTLREFQANANNVRSTLISGIANAAGVDTGHVTITGVMTRTRRVLGPDRAGSLLQVQISVVGARRVGDLAGHLDGVVVRDSWDVVPQVMVLSIPPGISLEQTV
jgi:hypothetical protein